MIEKSNRERLSVIESNIKDIKDDITEIKLYHHEMCDKVHNNANDIRGVKAIGAFIITVISGVIVGIIKKLW
jgi:hypothetical protein